MGATSSPVGRKSGLPQVSQLLPHVPSSASPMRMYSSMRLSVTIWQLAPAEKLTGAALAAYHYAQQEHVLMKSFSLAIWQQYLLSINAASVKSGVIVDALLGTGIVGSVRPEYVEAIEAINRCDWPVLALDIPSGVNADTGDVGSTAIKANATISFIGLKLGLFTAKGRAFSGQRYFSDLAVPESIYPTVSAVAQRLQLDDVVGAITPRPIDAHKRNCGHLVVIGGDHGFGGAPLMAAEMAMRCGAGMVSIATRSEHISAILARRPELMTVNIASGQKLHPLLQKASGLVIGPGMGCSTWSIELLSHAMAVDLPLVIDADALNLLANNDLPLHIHDRQWILTPHPGEAARLLGISNSEVQADRIQAARDIQGCSPLDTNPCIVEGNNGKSQQLDHVQPIMTD